ncbi:MAG: transcriptional repressor NrdR [Deltaproteobacteria bacterium]|nr:transcriptional repressor NrdR [Deltaproteobacteria bacterium]
MRCPYCKHQESSVTDSRITSDGTAIRRRRVCELCERRFTTYERLEEFTPMVIKKDGRREEFNRTKIIDGMKKACEKRAVGIEEIEEFVNKLEMKLQEGMQREVHSSEIGEEIMRFLRRRDQVAYVRFASVYRSFEDVTEFMEELRSLARKRNSGERKIDESRRLPRKKGKK